MIGSDSLVLTLIAVNCIMFGASFKMALLMNTGIQSNS